jgi:hypothetical protein
MGAVRDVAGILALQEKNLVTKISEEQKKNGFVTTPFTGEQLESLVALDGLFVIDQNGTIAGYAVAAGWDYFSGRPMFDHMIGLFAEILYKGVRIARENSFQYGPVCVDLSLRGSDAFPRLFATMRESMSARYAVGTTFINKINGRSFRAHTEKARIDVINEFDFNGKNYYGLAFLTK